MPYDNDVPLNEYDTDKIAKAVSSFVKDYNSLVSSTADSSSRYVLNSASNMVNYTRANADLLKKIGISVGSDNKLTVDEDKLKASDMDCIHTHLVIHTTSTHN